MDDAYLQELLSVLGPEGLQAMLDAGLMQDKMGLLSSDMERGQRMAQTPSAQGMNVGGTYVAASPLEHIATAMSRIMGNRQMDAARMQGNELVAGKGKGLNAFIQAMQTRKPVPPHQDNAPQDGGEWMGVPYR